MRSAEPGRFLLRPEARASEPVYHRPMHTALSRIRATLWRSRTPAEDGRVNGAACSWDAMRATYEEQAARGVPEAVRGLELIEEGRWPTSGRPREGANTTDG
jgi:hypothetical protein